MGGNGGFFLNNNNGLVGGYVLDQVPAVASPTIPPPIIMTSYGLKAGINMDEKHLQSRAKEKSSEERAQWK
jgi:hypothetical protein